MKPLFALLLAFSLLNCGDTTTSPPTSTSTSKVEFTYSGNVTGSFKAEGAYPSNEEGEGTTSTLSSDRRTVTIIAIDWSKKGSEATFISFTLNSSAAIVDNQVFTTTNSSSQFSALVGVGIDYPGAAGESYVAGLGTLTLTTVKDNQIKGTFEFSAMNGAGKTITVAAGKLDVKYN